ncbi:MAG TPA: non-canonical purine NTP pyrophosphatase [Patescibacteria group bacterium]|nr:non-canonical purine NTP pyrophosphatase [Patescibacteria group bacterium]
MLLLVTTNPAKYEPFHELLKRLRIELTPPKAELPELQCLTFAEAIAHKARTTAQSFGHPVLVDDAGLILEAYESFPGPLTSVVLSSLGQPGLQKLLNGVSNRASMQCHIGWWGKKGLRTWSGVVKGRLDLSRTASNKRMLLSDLFVPDTGQAPDALPHRARALAELESAAFELHLESSPDTARDEFTCPSGAAHQCPFCIEIEGTGQSIFSDMLGERLASRVLYQDEDFVVMPPLGQFIEGGLLLLSRQHMLSFSWLSPEKYARLERLLNVIRKELTARWGVAPIVFEHGPAPDRSKGVCCVDHAHFNIFPAAVEVRPHLTGRMNMPIQSLDQMARLRGSEFGYLLVEENDGSMRAYDGHMVPTQLVRRIITSQLGMSQRWHWQDYPGYDELIATYKTLQNRIRL